MSRVADYMRRSQSAYSLQLATSEVAGLAVLPEDAELRAVYAHAGQTVYAFDGFTLKVRYPHEELVAGEAYPGGTVVGGEYLKFYYGHNRAQWWQEVDWGYDGLPLDGICPVVGLYLPNRMVRFYQVSTWDAGGTTKKHVRADFSEDATAMDRFWYQLHLAEERCGLALADLDEFAALGPSTDVFANILDVYMRNGLGDRAIVVDSRVGELGDSVAAAALGFARREKPFGSVLVVRDLSFT